MIVLFGKTCSGKTTVAKKLEETAGIPKVVTVTTRERRPDEISGVDYIFVSQDEFNAMKEEGKFAETADFVMSGNRHVSYGSLREDYEDGEEKVIVLTPSGLRAVRDAGIPVFAVYLSLDNEAIRKRLVIRGDDPLEAERRLRADDIDFAGAEKLADLVIDAAACPYLNAIRIADALLLTVKSPYLNAMRIADAAEHR